MVLGWQWGDCDGSESGIILVEMLEIIVALEEVVVLSSHSPDPSM